MNGSGNFAIYRNKKIQGSYRNNALYIRNKCGMRKLIHRNMERVVGIGYIISM